jgi:hypothetical protein
VCDDVTRDALQDYGGADVYVNAACPRLAVDDAGMFPARCLPSYARVFPILFFNFLFRKITFSLLNIKFINSYLGFPRGAARKTR